MPVCLPPEGLPACLSTHLPTLPLACLQLGAECVKEAGEGVTHVVATDVTDKTRWARSHVGGVSMR